MPEQDQPPEEKPPAEVPAEDEFTDEDDVTSPTPCCGGGPHRH